MPNTVSLWPTAADTDEPFAAVWQAAREAALHGPQGRGEPAPEGWREWLETLFPKHVRWGFAPHHEALWEWVDAITPESSPDPWVSILARGGGKSSSAELAVTKLGVTGARRYALYVRETQEMADKSVGNVAALLESEAVERHYPEHAQKSVNKFGASRGWRRNRLVTAGGFVVDALGLDVAARGVKFEEQRPDLLIFDDIDAKHDTLATTLKKIATITTSILPAGAPNLAVLAIQNLIISDGFFTRMVDGRADYLSRRTVSGPHPALLDFSWEYQEQGGGRPRRALITGGTPTWEGQGLAVCQHQIDVWGLSSFIQEAQHQVQDKRVGLALKFEAANHSEVLTDEECWELVAMGRVFGGVDFQRWRFAFSLEAVDRQGVVHQIAEYFSQDEDLEHRARVIHALCTHYRCPPRIRIWGDSANPTDIAEITKSLKTIGSSQRVIGVGREAKLRVASVERWNNELARRAVFVREDVVHHCTRAVQKQWSLLGYSGEPPDLRRWMLGQNAGHRGTEMFGSRLVWEMENWSYPVPKPGKAQEKDPDDDTADGADAIAARRYALMSWWRPAAEEKEAEKPNRNTDRGLENLLDHIAREQQRARGEGGLVTGAGGLKVGGGMLTTNGNGKR